MNARTKILIGKFINKFGIVVTSNKTLPKANLTSFCHKLKKTGYNPNLILDIGANKSSWSEEAAVFFPNCSYLLVEPQSELNSYLEEFCSKQKKSKFINYGVGSKKEEKLFTLTPDTVSSSFHMTEDYAKQNGFKQRVIKITTVNDIVKEHLNGACPDIIKVDAEGSEFEILLGSTDVIGKTEIILLELHFFKSDPDSKDFSDMIRIMDQYGYAPLDFTSILLRPHDRFPGLIEVAFALKDGIVRNYKGW